MIHFLEAIIKNDGQWQRQQDLGSSRNSADTRPSSVPGRCICGNDFELCVETQRITIPWPFVKTVKTLPGPLPCLYACASSWWAKSHGSCASPQAWIVLPCNLPRPRKSLELLEEVFKLTFKIGHHKRVSIVPGDGSLNELLHGQSQVPPRENGRHMLSCA